MRQVAVRAMQFDDIVADAVDALRGRDEFANHALDVVLGHRLRHRPAGVVGDCRRRFRRPGVGPLEDRLAAGGGRHLRTLAARVRELHAELGDAVLPAEVVHALERLLVVVGIHAGALGRDAALRADVGHLGHDQAGGAERHIAEMHQVPIGGRAVVGIVLAHRRDHDAVGQRQPAHGEGREQNASHCRIVLSSGEKSTFPCDRRAWRPPDSRAPRTRNIRRRR